MPPVSSVPRLRVEAQPAPDRVVLTLRGELDLAAAPLLAAEIERAEGAERPIVVLDLAELEFIDSTGLRVILAARERAVECGREFAVTPGTPQVRRLFEIAGVSEHLKTIPTSDAVLAGGSGASD